MDEFDTFIPIEHLVIKRLLGRGGFATVYQGTYERPGLPKETVAIKVLHPNPKNAANSEDTYTRMFLREAACIRQQEHSHIVRCYGVCKIPPRHSGLSGLDKATLAMVLELAEPCTAKALIVQSMSEGRRTYTNLQAYQWLAQVASALVHLHSKRPRIIHRDIKNENVLLCKAPGAEQGAHGRRSSKSQLVAKLADLGLHVVLEDDRSVMLRRKSETGTNRSVHSRCAPKLSSLLLQDEGAGAASTAGARTAGTEPCTPFFKITAGTSILGSAPPSELDLGMSEPLTRSIIAAPENGGGGGSGKDMTDALVMAAPRIDMIASVGTAQRSNGTSGDGSPESESDAVDDSEGGANLVMYDIHGLNDSVQGIHDVYARPGAAGLGGETHTIAEAASDVVERVAAVPTPTTCGPTGPAAHASRAPVRGLPSVLTPLVQVVCGPAVQAPPSIRAAAAQAWGARPADYRHAAVVGRRLNDGSEQAAEGAGGAGRAAFDGVERATCSGRPPGVVPTAAAGLMGTTATALPLPSDCNAGDGGTAGGGSWTSLEPLPLAPMQDQEASYLIRAASGNPSPRSREVTLDMARDRSSDAARESVVTADGRPAGCNGGDANRSGGGSSTRSASRKSLAARPVSGRSGAASAAAAVAASGKCPTPSSGGLPGPGVLWGQYPQAEGAGDLSRAATPPADGSRPPEQLNAQPLQSFGSVLAVGSLQPTDMPDAINWATRGHSAPLPVPITGASGLSSLFGARQSAAGAGDSGKLPKTGAAGACSIGSMARSLAGNSSRPPCRIGDGGGAAGSLAKAAVASSRPVPSPDGINRSVRRVRYQDAAAGYAGSSCSSRPCSINNTAFPVSALRPAVLGHQPRERLEVPTPATALDPACRQQAPRQEGDAEPQEGLRQREPTAPSSGQAEPDEVLLQPRESIWTAIRHNPDLVQPVGLDSSFPSGMRRVRSLLLQFRLTELRTGRKPSMEWVFGLTGKAGSCMYMAPEVFRNLPYNEKADVFSFAVLMYELLSREVLIISYFNTIKGIRLGLKSPEDYAEKVCEGFRPPRPDCLSGDAWSLIEACWHDDPVQRPSMEEVLERLVQLRDQEEAQPTDPRGVFSCGPGCTLQ